MLRWIRVQSPGGDSDIEVITDGLDGLADRLDEYRIGGSQVYQVAGGDKNW